MSPRRPSARLVLALWPFAAGAAGVNLFFLSLILSWLGAPVLTPAAAALGGAAAGIPAAWLFTRHLCRLMDRADRRP